MADGKSLLVAEMTLISTLIVVEPPTRSNCLSWIALNNLTCNSGLISPISSRKIVPWSASSNRPILERWAPVKAPFSCPNNSLSRSSPGIAPQLITTMGPLCLELFLWMAFAINSLPVPLSPDISTEESDFATFLVVSRTFVNPLLVPAIPMRLKTSFEDFDSQDIPDWFCTSDDKAGVIANLPANPDQLILKMRVQLQDQIVNQNFLL